MPIISQRTIQNLWLPLLMVFVLAACFSNPVCCAESQLQEIELESVYEPDSSEGDTSISAVLPVKFANDLLTVLNVAAMLSVVSGSDAYPSSILHGPPVTNTSA